MALWLLFLSVASANAALPLVDLTNDDKAELDRIYLETDKIEGVRQGCVAGDFGGANWKMLHVYCLTTTNNRFRIILQRRINSVEITCNKQNSQFACSELQLAKPSLENYLTPKEKRKGLLFFLTIDYFIPPPESLACAFSVFDANRTMTLSFKPLGELKNIHVAGMDSVTGVNIFYDKNDTQPISVFDVLTPAAERLLVQYGSMVLQPVGNTFPALGLVELLNGNIHSIPKGTFRNAPNLQRLHIKYNNITDLDNDAFEGLSKLDHLDLTDNGISSLPEGIFRFSRRIRQIHLTQNRITELAAIFTRLPRLETIWINQNKVELTIHNRTFANLRNLEQLNLDSSGISSLPHDVFRNSTHLKNLILSNNKISEIPQSLFFGLQLRFLLLDRNMIKGIPVGLFTDVKDLESLDLGYNMIDKLDDLVFFDLKKLMKLDLTGNRIKILRPTLFDFAPQIEVLFLTDNDLTISKSDNTYPPTDAYLSSQDNEYDTGPYSPFQNLRNLKRLILKGNNISVICTDWRSSYALELLDLSNNSVALLSNEDMHFRSGPTVDLTNNRIKYFDPYIYESNQRTPTFKLNNNPYDCSCSFLPFVQKLSDGKNNLANLELNAALCTEPAALKDKKIDQILEFSMEICNIVTSNASAVDKLGIFPGATSSTPMDITVPSTETSKGPEPSPNITVPSPAMPASPTNTPTTQEVTFTTTSPVTSQTIPVGTPEAVPSPSVPVTTPTIPAPTPEVTVPPPAVSSTSRVTTPSSPSGVTVPSPSVPVSTPTIPAPTLEVTVPPPATSSTSRVTPPSSSPSGVTVPSPSVPITTATIPVPTPEVTVPPPAVSSTSRVTTQSSTSGVTVPSPSVPVTTPTTPAPTLEVTVSPSVTSSTSRTTAPSISTTLPPDMVLMDRIPDNIPQLPLATPIQTMLPKPTQKSPTFATSSTRGRNIYNINISFIINSPNNTIIVNPSSQVGIRTEA